MVTVKDRLGLWIAAVAVMLIMSGSVLLLIDTFTEEHAPGARIVASIGIGLVLVGGTTVLYRVIRHRGLGATAALWPGVLVATTVAVWSLVSLLDGDTSSPVLLGLALGSVALVGLVGVLIVSRRRHPPATEQPAN